MPKFCADLSMLFREHDFCGLLAASKAVFAADEYVGPHAFPKEQGGRILDTNNLNRYSSISPETGRRASAQSAACRTGWRVSGQRG